MEIFGIQLTLGKVLLLIIIGSYVWSQIKGKRQQTKVSAQTLDEWGLEAVRFYRPLGFFEHEAKLTDEALAKKLMKQLREEYGEAQIDRSDPRFSDHYLLALDRDQVWADDLEADVAAGNDVYATVIADWAKLSAGQLKVSKVTERWESDDGPVTLKFSINGTPTEITIKQKDDWIDPIDILEALNQALKGSGYHYAFGAVDQTGYVVFAKQTALDAMRRERNVELL